MIPVKEFIKRIMELVASDDGWLASSDPIKIALVVSEFTPSPDLVLEALTLATFTGSAPKTIVTGTQNVVRDSLTEQWGILLKEPAGGLNFICTADPAEPQTVYGYALVVNDEALIASAVLDVPVTITAIGDNVLLSAVFGFQAYIPIS